MVCFLAKVEIFRFLPKTMDYSQAFLSNSLRTHNSSMEDAMKLKFAPLCSPWDALSGGMLFGEIFRFLPKTMDGGSMSLSTHVLVAGGQF